MNRFLPDSLLEALLRPFAMAAPGGWIYIEVIAPDFRFVFMILALLLLAALAWKRWQVPAVVVALVAVTAVAFVPWLLTTGNGRYFIPFLTLSGILSVALVRALPLTANLRFTLVLLMVAIQGTAMWHNNPWNAWNGWGLHDWTDPPYYGVVLDQEAKEQPATYVTFSGMTFSVLAPQFAPGSRWMNVAALVGTDADHPDVARARAIMAAATRLRVLMPVIEGGMDANGLPTPYAREHVGRLMRVHSLRFAGAEGGCRLLPMRAEARSAEPPSTPPTSESPQVASVKAQTGFWVCEAAYEPAPPEAQANIDARSLEVFAVMERVCPRLFPPGQKRVIPLPAGVLRHYGSADMKLYVLSGGVYFKYHRALNFSHLGTVDQVLAPGFTYACDQVPGRSLPWVRGL